MCCEKEFKPPMNADKRRSNEKLSYRRSSAFIGGQIMFSAGFVGLNDL
jgi:hypothetical protein